MPKHRDFIMTLLLLPTCPKPAFAGRTNLSPVHHVCVVALSCKFPSMIHISDESSQPIHFLYAASSLLLIMRLCLFVGLEHGAPGRVAYATSTDARTRTIWPSPPAHGVLPCRTRSQGTGYIQYTVSSRRRHHFHNTTWRLKEICRPQDIRMDRNP